MPIFCSNCGQYYFGIITNPTLRAGGGVWNTCVKGGPNLIIEPAKYNCFSKRTIGRIKGLHTVSRDGPRVQMNMYSRMLMYEIVPIVMNVLLEQENFRHR
jgi:hypothetical protein